jgi:hypothetical protein
LRRSLQSEELFNDDGRAEAERFIDILTNSPAADRAFLLSLRCAWTHHGAPGRDYLDCLRGGVKQRTSMQRSVEPPERSIFLIRQPQAPRTLDSGSGYLRTQITRTTD